MVYSLHRKSKYLPLSFDAISIINKQLDFSYKRIISNTTRGWERETMTILLAVKECLLAVILADRFILKKSHGASLVILSSHSAVHYVLLQEETLKELDQRYENGRPGRCHA